SIAKKNLTDVAGEPLPDEVSATTIHGWFHFQPTGAETAAWPVPWQSIKATMTLDVGSLPAAEVDQLRRQINYLPPKLAEMFSSDVDALAAKRVAPRVGRQQLLDIYVEAEKHGCFDHWLNAYLWRKTADVDAGQLAVVFARMQRHARITDTLIRA